MLGNLFLFNLEPTTLITFMYLFKLVDSLNVKPTVSKISLIRSDMVSSITSCLYLTTKTKCNVTLYTECCVLHYNL